MDQNSLFLRFGVALLIGILVGFQREFAFKDDGVSRSAGVRTFGIMGLLGCAAARLSEIMGSALPLASTILVIGIFLALNHYLEARNGKPGLTTQSAVILVFITGALVYSGRLTMAVALGVVTTVILSAKYELHTLARKVTREDVYASLKFAVITAVVLPVLPDKAYGIQPLNVFNPFKIWLLVVFISGISFVGFVLIKLVGPKKGIGITGLLGGIASSTALTLSFTQRSKTTEGLSKPLAMAIIIAWTVMFSRVVIEVAVLNIALVGPILLPLAAPVLAGLAYCLYLYFMPGRHKGHEPASIANPFELGPAIKFGLIFTVILAVSKIAVVYFGDAGVYFSAFFSGLADVDAIALSLADLSRTSMRFDTAARAIVLAGLANTLAKGGIVIFAGAPGLRRAILPGYVLMLGAAGVGMLLI